jgi:hypothetical protein
MMSQNETVYECILREAATARATHDERMAAKARRHYRRHPHADGAHEARMLHGTWWRYVAFDVRDTPTQPSRPTEYAAILRVWLSQAPRHSMHTAQTERPAERVWCGGCQTWKSTMDFWSNRNNRNGYDHLCKSCRLEANNKYRKAA